MKVAGTASSFATTIESIFKQLEVMGYSDRAGGLSGDGLYFKEKGLCGYLSSISICRHREAKQFHLEILKSPLSAVRATIHAFPTPWLLTVRQK